MIVFALDCSQDSLSLAFLKDGKLIRSYQEAPQEQHSVILLKRIHQFFEDEKLSLDDVDQILFCHGPGSFTSLRIAHSTLLGLYLGMEKQPLVYSASSLFFRCLCLEQEADCQKYVALMKAGRNRAYVGLWRPQESHFEEKVLSFEDLDDVLRKESGFVLVAEFEQSFLPDDFLSKLKFKSLRQHDIQPSVFSRLYQCVVTQEAKSLNAVSLNYLLQPDIG